MKTAGLTLNLISMFGLIVVLGMLVDDAIIVAEHIYTKIEHGEEPALAAVRGAEEVTKPVTCAIITSIFAFLPLLFIEGVMGDVRGRPETWTPSRTLVGGVVEPVQAAPARLAGWHDGSHHPR